MLVKLSIRNYAIIEELEIGFSGNLNVITGETGAGKSIIMGALGLILGERADTSALVNKEKKCIVEGVFDETGKRQLKDFFEKYDYDRSDELVIRREIATNGKSRAFINDTPVSLSQLNELSRLLVDLHQQFNTLELTEHDFQRDVLDALAENASLRDRYQALFVTWQKAKKELEELKARKQQFDREADYNQFQFAELEEAGFSENELENIDNELKMLQHAEGIKGVVSQVCMELNEKETPVTQQLKILINQLNTFASFHPDLPGLVQRLQSAQIELQDIAGDLEHINSHINFDPQKMELLNERLSLGYRLQKKHGVSSTNELIRIQEQLGEKLLAVLNMDETIQQKEKELANMNQDISLLAREISGRRHKQAKPLEEKVNKLLAQVGMPNAKLKVAMTSVDLNRGGSDAIEFLFDANLPAGETAGKGQYLPVRKVASGGELSRLMLCIKSLIAQSIDLPTLIFDEIDSGISGEAAKQVGLIMKDLSAKRQVISITHQPQIAGKADAHLFVYKEIVKNTVKTNIRLLTTEERITAIAKMLSGEKPTAAAMENAREMLMN